MKTNRQTSWTGWMRRTLLALPALAVALPAAGQISVDDLELFLRADDDGASGVIRVTNDGAQPAQVLVDVQDWRRDASGTNEFLPAGSLERSCRERLQVFPMGLRIEPGETQPLRVTFSGAADTSCWNIVFVQTNEPPRASTQSSQITYVMRTGVKVYVEPAEARRDGLIESVRALPDSTDGVRRVEVTFKNLGEAHLKPVGAMEIRRADNSVAGRVEMTEFPLEPGALRRLTLELPALPAGQYVLLALLDYGGPDIAAGQLELVVR